MTPDINDMLDERETGAGEYPDWWEPEEEGDKIQGIVRDVRDDPWAEEDDREPAAILEVETDEGGEWSTRPHSVLDQLIKDQNVEEGDYVRIIYQGSYRTNSGNMANNYKLAVVKADELEEVGTDGGTGATTPTVKSNDSTSEPEETETPDEPEVDAPVNPDNHTVAELETQVESLGSVEDLETVREAEEQGADRKSVYDVIDRRLDELDTDDSDDESVENDSEFDDEVLEFADNISEYHDDEMEREEFQRYIEDVRGFDVDLDALAAEVGLEFEE